MQTKYGLNYQDSKNKIAEWVLDNIPHADNFYDLFGGGGAVTHAAIRSGKFRNFVFNDLNPLCQGFVKAANGEYSDERLQHFISREEYDRTRRADEIAFFCYSFGGNGENYLYAKELEPFKAALHKARVFGDMSDLKAMGCPSAARKWIFEHLETVKHAYTDWYLSEVLKTDLTYADYKGKLHTQIKQRVEELREYLCDAFKQSGLKSKREVGIRLGTNMERHYFGKSQWEFPTADAYAKMQEFMPLPRSYESLFGLDGYTADVDIRSLISLEKLTSFYSLEHWQNIQRLRSLRGLCTQAMRGVCGKYNDVDIAPNSVVYCFDEKTEILTQRGWLNVGEVTLDDYCLSREPNTAKLEWVKVVNLISYHYNGKMYQYKGKNVSLCVTPNHRMFTNTAHTRQGIYTDEFCTAESLFTSSSKRRFVSAGGDWQVPNEPESVEICGESFRKSDFAYLIGIFVTDGSVNNKGSISITQKKENIISKIENVLKTLKIKYSIYIQRAGVRTFYISRKYLPFFKQFYLKEKRKIPRFIKEWGKIYLNKLMEGMLDGDSDGERRRIILGSKSLVNDIQEICYKIGLSSCYTLTKPHKSFLKSENRYIESKKDCYVVSINTKPYLSVLKYNQSWIDYDGQVNCVTLEKWHTVLVRREGKCVWCGQCDIPYSSTAGYVTGDFDHAEFYKWAMRQKALVLISEYNMPEPDFVAVAQTKVVCTLSAYNNAKTATERLYVPRHQLAEYKKRIGLLF